MTAVAPVLETSFADLRLFRRGKVRDVYEIDSDRLLIVATDRISAFDCVIPTPIERKGEVLTALSRFWFARLAHIVPNHLLTTEIDEMPEAVQNHAAELRRRSMLVRRTNVFPVEGVVRGYLSGSGWKDYQGPPRFAAISCHKACAKRNNCPNQYSPLQQRPKPATMKTSANNKWPR